MKKTQCNTNSEHRSASEISGASAFLKFPSFEYERSHQILPSESYAYILQHPVTVTAFHTIYQSSDPTKGCRGIKGNSEP